MDLKKLFSIAQDAVRGKPEGARVTIGIDAGGAVTTAIDGDSAGVATEIRSIAPSTTQTFVAKVKMGGVEISGLNVPSRMTMGSR